jgi:hypothetical protein
MRQPVFVLARGVAVPYLHTRLARLETDALLLTTLGTAVGNRIVMIIHPNLDISRNELNKMT